MSQTSEIYLLKDSALQNIQYVKSHISPFTEICSVVKGNAYGHGADIFVPIMIEGGIHSFAVYSTDEARAIHHLLPDYCRLMVMGDVSEEGLIWCIEHEIEFYVFSIYRLNIAVVGAKAIGKKAKIHIEIETGMHRTGFDEFEFDALEIHLKNDANYLDIIGICTHFAGAELNENRDRIENQISRFNSAVAHFESKGINAEIRHACCSAAMMKLPDMHLDLVRVGILLYGFWPSKEMEIEYAALNPEAPNPLRRVIRWQSRIMSLKHVPTGAWIGYGESFSAQTDMRIAVVPVGYAHGYARSLSNYGQVLVNGCKVPVLGFVNMNCISIDVSKLNDVEIGDEVILIGNQHGEELSVASFSERSEQLNYELLTRLPRSIPRFQID